jgi:4'-phosphopantetheinyl transferase
MRFNQPAANCGLIFYPSNIMPNPIYWMLVDSHQAALETPEILSPSELQKYSTFRFPKRRDEWLLGRWTAKALVHSIPAYQHYSLDQIEIRNAPEGAPYIQMPDRATPAECLTISHSGIFALCALATGLDLQVGTDLERIEEHTKTFILDYLTPVERQLVDKYPAETRAMVVTLIWSAKESMLKALGVGLRRDTRKVEVFGLEGLPPTGEDQGKWQRVRIGEQPASDRAWAAWWQRRDSFVLTLAGFAARQKEIRSVRLIEQLGR